MAERGALERGHVKIKLIRELAAGEHSQAELARRHDVTPQSMSEFTQRHAERIAEVAEKLLAQADAEFAGLWVAEKRNRIAEYQQQIDDVADLMADPALAAKAGVQAAEMFRVAQSALKAVAEELGQLPGRVQVQHSGSLEVRVNGVDVAALT